MELDPDQLTPHERYKLLVGCITPRPIAFVSTQSPAGRNNLAPYSFFNAAGADPMTVVFCPVVAPDGSDKDTLKNLLPAAEGGLGQFVVNLAVEAYARQMVLTSEPLAYEESEFELAGFTPAPCRKVVPPRVAESPVSFECATDRVVRLNSGVPMSGNVVIGRVLHVWIRSDLVDERLHVDPARLATIGRMGGTGYTRTRERFHLARGRELRDAPPPFDTDVGAARARGADD